MALNKKIFYCEHKRTKNSIIFTAYKEDEQFTDDEILEAQEKMGFHPMGYGSFAVTQVEYEKGYWRAIWTCLSSCD